MNRFKELKNYGWIEHRMNDATVNHIWDCIESQGKSMKNSLVGQIDKSYFIEDIDHLLWNNLLVQCGDVYQKTWGNPCILPIASKSDKDFILYLEKMWVNYQNKHEYNPLHNHKGVYSFVVWMKIPTDYKEQQEQPNAKGSNGPQNSSFYIQYVDILGQFHTFNKEMNPEDEGTMLFFPSALVHGVNPFYNCDEPRISISGNLLLDPEIQYDSTPPQVVPVATTPMKTL